MRSVVRLQFVLVALCLGLAATARAQALPGGFNSYADYIVGTWKWERMEPRQTMIMRFERGGAFYFNNYTIKLEHWGSYSASNGQLNISLNRSCEDKTTCENRSPPKELQYQFQPNGADVFMAGSERWERQGK